MRYAVRKRFEKRFLSGGERAVGGDEEGDGEVVVVDEPLGELTQGDEVAHPRSWNYGYVGWWLFHGGFR